MRRIALGADDIMFANKCEKLQSYISLLLGNPDFVYLKLKGLK
jgi:hypothetical protein